MVMNFRETFATQARNQSEAETCVDTSHAVKTSHRYYKVGLAVESTGNGSWKDLLQPGESQQRKE